MRNSVVHSIKGSRDRSVRPRSTRTKVGFACSQQRYVAAPVIGIRSHEALPAAEVRAFALVRTMGLIPDVAQLLEPCVGEFDGLVQTLSATHNAGRNDVSVTDAAS